MYYAEALSITELHDLDGATFLAKECAATAVVGLVARHTGAAIEADERGHRRQRAALPGAEPAQ